MFRFSIRSLLVATAIVAAALGLFHYWRMERLSRLHAQEAEQIAQARERLQSVNYDVPPAAMDDLRMREEQHRILSREYRQKIWEPWRRSTASPPSPPAPSGRGPG
jgi:hypothetical protein